LARDPARQLEASKRNIEVARMFSEEALAARRLTFPSGLAGEAKTVRMRV
jgi:hypothetical protein